MTCNNDKLRWLKIEARFLHVAENMNPIGRMNIFQVIMEIEGIFPIYDSYRKWALFHLLVSRPLDQVKQPGNSKYSKFYTKKLNLIPPLFLPSIFKKYF